MSRAGRVGDVAHVPSDSHDCPHCPHVAMGPAVSGSNNVLINNRCALRANDKGLHVACCDNNRWLAQGGAKFVLINNRRPHRLGDPTAHCGGRGVLLGASNNVCIGDHPAYNNERNRSWALAFQLLDPFGRPRRNSEVTVHFEDGSSIDRTLDNDGRLRLDSCPKGHYFVRVRKSRHA